MSKGNTFENDLLLLIFNATAIGNIADNAAFVTALPVTVQPDPERATATRA